MQLEAIVAAEELHDSCREAGYAFEIAGRSGSGLPYVEPRTMWRRLLDDVQRGTPVSLMSARFHLGLSRTIAAMVSLQQERERQRGEPFQEVALTGGCFQNALLLRLVSDELTERGFDVMTHSQVPPNDGGLALGQVAVAAALRAKEEDDTCA